MNLSQAKPTPKQLNLNKLSGAVGSQIHWQATLAKTDSSSDFGINPLQSMIYTEPLLSLSRCGMKGSEKIFLDPNAYYALFF